MLAARTRGAIAIDFALREISASSLGEQVIGARWFATPDGGGDALFRGGLAQLDVNTDAGAVARSAVLDA